MVADMGKKKITRAAAKAKGLKRYFTGKPSTTRTRHSTIPIVSCVVAVD
jgi:hypothetical protein